MYGLNLGRGLHLLDPPEIPSTELPEIFCCFGADVSEELHLDASHWLPTHGHICMADLSGGFTSTADPELGPLGGRQI